MCIYTYVHIVQKWASTPIPRPCHDHKLDTSPVIRRRFINITPKKSAIPRVQFLTGRGVIWVTYRCYNINPYLVTISHQEVKCSTTCMGWADNELITTGDSCKVKSCNSMTVRGGRTEPLLMMAIRITHKQERGTNILSLHCSHDASKQFKILSARSGLR